MRNNILDINADMGESFGNWSMGRDAELMPLITTANMACGFHASDPQIMGDRVAEASRLQVAVGAHPGLPDLMGFGRRRMGITAKEARAYVLYQVGALKAFLDVNQEPLHHIKPHGALYLMINEEEAIARAVMQAVSELQTNPLYYWPAPIPAGVVRAADHYGVQLVPEFYVDTRYDDEGGLILQRVKTAASVPLAVETARRFVLDGYIESAGGEELVLDADSLCIHGDGPNCVEVVSAVREFLASEGVGFAAAERQGAGTAGVSP
ncbi:MAG: 5-oxoprolinase subunit PxpA [Actinomycetes bacterium]